MQKIFALVLSMILTLGVGAFAEGIEVTQIDWSEEAEQAFIESGYSGTWYTLNGIGCELIIPDGYAQRDLTEEEAANNIVFCFANEENGGVIYAFDTVFEGIDDLVTLGGAIKDQDPEALVQYARINGAAAIITGSEEADSIEAIFDLGGNRFVRLMFTPVLRDDQLLTLCVASIRFNLQQ